MNDFMEAKEDEVFVDKIKKVCHGDGWGYELTLNDNDDYLFSIKSIDYDNERKEYVYSGEKLEISTIIIRRLAEEILSMLPEKK